MVLTENGQSGVFLCVIIRGNVEPEDSFSRDATFLHSVHGWKCRSRFLPFLPRIGSPRTTPNEKKWLPLSKVFHHSNDDSSCVKRDPSSRVHKRGRGGSEYFPLVLAARRERAPRLVV